MTRSSSISNVFTSTVRRRGWSTSTPITTPCQSVPAAAWRFCCAWSGWLRWTGCCSTAGNV